MAPSQRSFAFPPFYSFPPSFTKQPVDATRASQVQLWGNLVRDYCQHYRIFWLDVVEAVASPLFFNTAISRRLSLQDAEFFLNEMVSRGDAEWDQNHQRCLIYWRRPAEWGAMIYNWVESEGRNGTVLTVYEIRLGDETASQEFHGLDLDLTIKALTELERMDKAAVFGGEASDQLGVKFL
mmetsp:Transcript_6940/g.21114  ORF Transcript_6940/g.21114 Transcript_6940/m.21114 type:complete len:181 (+) Transcript_6940:125-667(+)|eukprot:CAMPEP_0198731444 /NCGR_PEP_ID=MMETSP1475-20131203/29857_1 /TAXON_ID= ORGANISM="Unidentified sp., Strain CCMP1999" /NCGR_SAMPLE_ID=MMETSP1475 /ASSEMBLY_ACC=CAM_ASM_001111 /LENGTH=180 /DNA_ID=CAMNT_0044494407 /DNA_START=65 /DNA_END=607 /DNA_ORIENTATION=-